MSTIDIGELLGELLGELPSSGHLTPTQAEIRRKISAMTAEATPRDVFLAALSFVAGLSPYDGHDTLTRFEQLIADARRQSPEK